jgi:small subunit ribosomal protein S1
MKDRESWKDNTPSPSQDDNWWAAVLADEEKYASAVSRSGSSSGAAASNAHIPDGDVNWERINSLQESETPIECFVVGYNRGGLLVDGSDFHGFVPISHLVDIAPEQMCEEREAALVDYVGKEIQLKVIECDPQRGRVVLSERAALTAPGERQRLFGILCPGDIVQGEVTNITDFGVFVDLGGVEGLIHISELSWGRVSHPREMISQGDRIDVMVLQVDGQRGRVALSIKRLCPNPWETAAVRYQLGDVTEVVITDVVKFGAFARLEEGLEGLIHISEMGLKNFTDPSEVLSEGQRVKARILQVEPDRQRMSLRLEVKDSTAVDGSNSLPGMPMEAHGR